MIMTSKEMCDYLASTGLYEKIDLSYAKDMIDSDKTIPISDLVERFIKIDKCYEGEPWNIRQILANIDIIIPVEDRKEKWEAKGNEQIIEKIKKMPNLGDTVYGIFRQTKIICERNNNKRISSLKKERNYEDINCNRYAERFY